ncbi:uncharacterized protein K460DRAFT_86489 [Cucurbitaria berberidis CBS 394.84]|uniref:Uncharacterized protein n=1 Tax=Cucurbitaria berberidis CBS 394.84 TaxID=1168544 RepID=A0A9P4GMJ6_9PLEO|nr:uncharacterized protein K460DRAFT_86489 [Cucurbitaria berberidis CBS 394.84]KAF1849163.1 hypothetical protein K460DRAFT_86489 [Cucurbitaria berberidis CBS 394.84]
MMWKESGWIVEGVGMLPSQLVSAFVYGYIREYFGMQLRSSAANRRAKSTGVFGSKKTANSAKNCDMWPGRLRRNQQGTPFQLQPSEPEPRGDVAGTVGHVRRFTVGEGGVGYNK